MPQPPNTSRWTPVPDKAALDLLQAKRYTALAVWLCMLRDAIRNQSWSTSRTLSALRGETGLSRQTILSAQRYLTEHGYIRPASGGGGSRRPITFTLTPVPNFNNGRTPPPAHDAPPAERPRGEWYS